MSIVEENQEVKIVSRETIRKESLDFIYDKGKNTQEVNRAQF